MHLGLGGPCGAGGGRGHGAHGVQGHLCQVCKSRAPLNCAIIYFNAFVVHIWVRVKYGPASFTGRDVN
jgi:hypothetical protein